MTIERLHNEVKNIYDYGIDVWKDLIRQPSISSNHNQVKQCAELLSQIMNDAGIRTQILRLKVTPLYMDI